jgi:NAD+-dependent protein deacetylase sirtuin 5
VTYLGLSPRANHPADQLYLIHGSLFDVRCTSYFCKYERKDDFTDPIVPALAIPTDGPQPEPSKQDKTGEEATKSLYDAMDLRADETPQGGVRRIARELDISNSDVSIPRLTKDQLPTCPECGSLLRPGVVWFGETLPDKTVKAIDGWMNDPEKVDLMLVIGTSSQVWPAAGYADEARDRGARVAVINMDPNDARGLSSQDWFFQGDAAAVVPEILKSVIGEIP